MNRFFRLRLLLHIMALVLALPGCSNQQAGQFDSANLGVSLSLKGNFEKKDDKTDDNVRYLKYQAGNDFLRIKVYDQIDDARAKKIKENKKFLTETLYEDQPSPYPGRLSNKLGCPDELKPKPFDDQGENGDWMFAFRIKSNERFVYGNCIEESNYFESAYIFYYCNQASRLFEIKYFTPKSNPVNDVTEFIRLFMINQ